MADTGEDRQPAARRIVVAFTASALASLGLAAVYVAGGQPQLEGALLAVSLGGIGVGLVMWAKRILPDDRATAPRTDLHTHVDAATALPPATAIARRPFLVRMLGAALGALGVAALFPIRSLGRAPGRELFTTAWRPGARVVDSAGEPVRAGQLDVGGVLTVFPEGATEAFDSQVVLIRVEPGALQLPVDRQDWTPDDNVAYSKICTHAGCPVGLYRSSTHELFCPCHQSTFDVLRGAEPVFGPADRALPQLPLDVDDDGFLVARGDFDEPAGPGFWDRP